MANFGHSKGQKMNRVAYMNKVVHLSMVLGAIMLLMAMAFIDLLADLSTPAPSRFAEVCAAEGGEFLEDECIMPQVVVRVERDRPSRSVRSWGDGQVSSGWASEQSYSEANADSGDSSGEVVAYGYATVGRPRESHWGNSASMEGGASAWAHAYGGN
jgi:hypothetical protein